MRLVMEMVMEMVQAAMAMAAAAMEAVLALNNTKTYSKCGFLATFFWLTNNSQFAIILV
jgi:hypothetical protein